MLEAVPHAVQHLQAGVDPVTAAYIIAAVYGAYSAKRQSDKAGNVPKPKVADPEADAKLAADAAKKKQLQGAGNTGLDDLLKTGPAGLGTTPDQNKGTKSLLGY